MEDIVFFSAIYHVRGLTRYFNDLKSFELVQMFGTDGREEGRESKVFQEVLADLKIVTN